MKTKHLIAASVATAAALPLTALAHVGSDGGGHHTFLDSFTHAIAHPFGGADHLAAMLAVGAWSALAFGKSGKAWAAPAGFVALLVAGCLAGFAGLQIPAIEPMIAASVLVLGLLVMVQQKMAAGAAAGLVGVFASSTAQPTAMSSSKSPWPLQRASSCAWPQALPSCTWLAWQWATKSCSAFRLWPKWLAA